MIDKQTLTDGLARLRRRLEAVDVITPPEARLFDELQQLVEQQYTEKLSLAFEVAVSNVVRSTKRSLLDFVDLWVETTPPDHRRVVEMVAGRVKRRIHNDVSEVQDKVVAAHRIFVAGGVIPPFGREEAAAAAPAPSVAAAG